MSRALLLADNVSHSFRLTSGELTALRDVSLRVGQGEFVAIVGPSGCGKTTLLRLFGGLIQPEAGRILFNGEPLREPPSEIGMVFQKPALLPWRTVWDNVRLPLQIAGKPEEPTRLRALLEAVGLAGFEAALPAELSGGMQQRVSLARALIGQPTLLLMDEPFGALDMMLRGEMNRLLLELWERERPTVVFVTHDLHEAVLLADRVIAMSPRPGHVVGNFAIDLSRPRTALDRYSREVQGHVERVWQAFDQTRSVRHSDE